MLRCGLLGEKLGHSYSPQIHSRLGDYEYRLFERAPEDVADFLKNGPFDGINVTIPYKKTVIPFCDELSDTARTIGSVNTVVRRPDGTLYGDNTDAFGLEKLIAHAGITVSGRKALVLGTGGASVTAVAVLKKLGACEVITVSRKGPVSYENITDHADAGVIVNATPAGMYPNNGECHVDLKDFPELCGVVDVVYNPSRTALLLQAEKLGIPHANGLYMLVAQAKRSSELFTGSSLPDSEIDRIEAELRHRMENLIVIGMPGSGKTTISAMLSEALGRELVDLDEEIVRSAGMTIPEIFRERGEDGFRAVETEAAAAAGKRSGLIISTGGGIVTRPENYDLLHQNGTMIWIQRDASVLPTDGRPLSQKTAPTELYKIRRPMYERFADIVIDNNGTPEETLAAILEAMK